MCYLHARRYKRLIVKCIHHAYVLRIHKCNGCYICYSNISFTTTYQTLEFIWLLPIKAKSLLLMEFLQPWCVKHIPLFKAALCFSQCNADYLKPIAEEERIVEAAEKKQREEAERIAKQLAEGTLSCTLRKCTGMYKYRSLFLWSYVKHNCGTWTDSLQITLGIINRSNCKQI